MIVTINEKSPVISDKAWVADNATLAGDIHVSDDASIWFNAVLRTESGPITIGKNTNIQDGVICHIDEHSELTIGDNVTVGHGAIVHCAEIGDCTLIGMGAIVLSGAKIGKNCIIAAGALIKENAVIPDNSMVVGIPGKIIREVSPERAAENKTEAEFYAAKSKKYLKANGK